jgi:hypothetical protein
MIFFGKPLHTFPDHALEHLPPDAVAGSCIVFQKTPVINPPGRDIWMA